MSNKKVRAGHCGFLKKVFEDVDACFENEFATVRKSELQKWKANLKEQLDKILPLDEEILAELAADEKMTEEEIADEIERSGRLKADATQRLAKKDWPSSLPRLPRHLRHQYNRRVLQQARIFTFITVRQVRWYE